MAAYLEDANSDEPAKHDCIGIVTLGRDDKSTIRIADPGVSRNHGIIREVGHEDFYLLDAGSYNGCYVNDRRITTPTQLKNGDVLRLGTASFRFCQEEPDELPETSMIGGDTCTMTVMQSHIRPIVVFVADIRGFTPMSETMPIERLSRMMTRWFNEVQALVADHGGRVDKFIGDCVMATWDAKDLGHSVMQALRTALAIQKATTALAADTEGLPDLRVGVGINTGLAALNIGLDSTAMGDTVNTAFRLETACKPLETDIVLSESSFEQLPDEFSRARHKVNLKGKAESLLAAALTYTELEALL